MSHAAKLTRDDALVRWDLPAHVIDRAIRACTPAPGAWTTLPDGSTAKIGPVVPVEGQATTPGLIRATEDGHRGGYGRQARARSAGFSLLARRPWMRATGGAAPAGPTACCWVKREHLGQRRRHWLASSRSWRTTPTRTSRCPRSSVRRASSQRDAAFATELAYGSLRMSGFYDEVIAVASGREPSSLEATVRAVLWIGAHQALDMSTPPHATVSETVDLAKDAGAARASGLVNAVMRRIVETDSRGVGEARRAGNGGRGLATRNSHPEWIVAELEASLAARGRAGEVEALLESHNDAGVASPWPRVQGSSTGTCSPLNPGESPTELSPYGVVLDGGFAREGRGGARTALRAFRTRESQLVAAALASASARPASASERWLDACAGPGGKTALLGALAATAGATLDAVELHPHRATLVSDNVRALPLGRGRCSHGRRHRVGGRALRPDSRSTRRVPGLGRCGAGPKRDGGVRRKILRNSPTCRPASSPTRRLCSRQAA